LLSAAAPPAAGVRDLFSIRPYRLYFASSTIGAFASAAQFLAIGWLVVAIAPDGPAVFAYLAVQFVAKMLLAVPAGLVADRLPRASVFAWMRIASGTASLLAAGALFSSSPMFVALAAAALAAAAHAFDLPAHRALQCEVQPRVQLERGLSLGSSGFHIAALVAPIVTFPLWVSAGPETPLLISAAAFFIAAIPAFAITLSPVVRAEGSHAKKDVREALRFLIDSPAVLALLLISVLPPVMGKVMSIALPTSSGHEGDGSFGLVLAATEFGAIFAGLVMTTVTWRFKPWIPTASALAYGGAIGAACVVMPVGAVAIGAALFLAGCAKTMLTSSAVAGIGSYTPAEMRGRLMTI
jgi:MFS family permease